MKTADADDSINPPELGILEREIKRAPKGRAITIPFGDKTRGREYLRKEQPAFAKATARPGQSPPTQQRDICT